MQEGSSPARIKDLEPEGEKNHPHPEMVLQLSVNSFLARRFLGFTPKELENDTLGVPLNVLQARRQNAPNSLKG